jgi:type I protein arginine methyltransferase
MYSVYDYGRMFSAGPRIRAYTDALQCAVKPGSVVVDIGAGTGIFAFLACELGAARVYAIEPDDAILVAEQIARHNKLNDRIVFIQQPSHQVTLPEKADVVVSDLRGALPLFQHHIPSIMDARRRFLKPEGVLIPQRDTLFATLIAAPDLYGDYSDVWKSFSHDMRAGRSHAIHTLRKYRPSPGQFLTAPQSFAVLDYPSIESPNITGVIEAEITQAGTAHGFSVWFDAEVADGITFSNAPEEPELVYGQMFFPLEQAVDVETGDQMQVAFTAKLIGGEYVWQWNTRITTRSNHHGFKQSTLLSTPLSLDQIRKTAPGYVPQLNASGTALLFALQQMQAGKSTEEVAQLLADAFSARFYDVASAQSYASELARKYTK